MAHWRRPWTGRTPMRLATRFAATTLLLLLLVQAAGFTAIRDSIDRTARAQLRQDLERGVQVWDDVLAQQARQINLLGRMAGRDFGFQTTLFGQNGQNPDEPTVASALETLLGRAGGELIAYVDKDGQVRGVVPGVAADADVRSLATRMAQGSGQRALQLLDGHPYHVVTAEILAPDRKGWLLMGFAVDRELLLRMRQLTGLEVALLAPRGTGQQVLLSTLAAPGEAALGPAIEAGDELLLQGEPMVTRRIGVAAAQVLLLRSVTEAVAPYRQLQWLLALITLAGVLVFGAGSAFTARRVTTPLQALVRASERLGRGEYGQPMHDQERGDEIGELARGFDHMRLNIAARAAEVQQLAYFDRLTGLPNRARFSAAVHAAIAASAAPQFAVVMLNLNRFKPVNDALGYRLGDRLLKAVADRLVAQVMREGDVVARLGGDEFALLLPGSDEARALGVTARIARAFELPLTLDEQTIDLSAAFGVACWPAHGDDADSLLSRAEIAMHEAKRRTEPVLVYASVMDPDSATTLSLLTELRCALERDELRLFLQPKFALASGAIVGAEALVRWQHPVRGMVPPMAFIPFAEKTGFVRQLTSWVFDAAARQWPALQAAGLQQLSVNLSARDLMDLELPQRLAAILLRHGVAATAFCLEITESAIMDDPQRAQNILLALKAMGFKLSIDDFGEGYTSLKYLKRLPIDELKVDQSFVLRMDRDAEDEKIVRAVIELAHNLGLSVVAEGVENAEVWESLGALACDQAQGYHMCRPLPAADLPAFAARWGARRALSSV